MKKYLLKPMIIGFLIVGFTIVGVDFWVGSESGNKLFDTSVEVPHNRVGVVLGTSKYRMSGNLNLYYKYRIDAAVDLFRSGKIELILISGDNGTRSYDEPSRMKKDLMARGIPKDKIFLDYAGFRTLDSMVRAHEVFGLNSFTVISQAFHNERALFIAKRKGMKAVGFNAKDVSKKAGFKTRLREKFARVKMLYDLSFNVQPKYLGDPVQIK